MRSCRRRVDRSQTPDAPDRRPAITDRAELRVLYVEDEALIALHAVEMLEDIGFRRVETAHGEAEALRLADERRFDLAILDVNLGRGRDSLRIAERLRRDGVPIVFCSGYDDLEAPFRDFDAPVIAKPISPAILRRTIERAIG